MGVPDWPGLRHVRTAPRDRKASSAHSGQRQVQGAVREEFATFNELTLGARFDGDVLVLRYQFNLKKFEATPSTVGVKKEKSELGQRFEPAQYLFPGGMVNHEPLEAAIADALETVASGF